MVKSANPMMLSEHPANGSVYGDGPVDDLVESIRHHGILEPLVITPEYTIISGHRRWRAARELRLQSVPVTIQSFQDEIVALVEFNRYRRKTWSQIYAECQVLLPRLTAAAAERRRAGARAGAVRRHGGNAEPTLPRSRVIDDLERCTGVNRERLRRLLRIREAIAAGNAPEEIAHRLDAGSLTMHQAYRLLRKKQRIERRQRQMETDKAAGRFHVDDLISPFDVWDFKRRDERFGRVGSASELIDNNFGAPPPQVLINLVHHFTGKDDTVIDPMGGNGTMLDVCRVMDRQCECFDLTPRRPDIRRHDATLGPAPDLVAKGDLLFLDPPYGNQYRYSGDSQDLCNAPTADAFMAMLERVITLWLPTVRPGGRVALLVGSEFRKGQMIDRAWEAGKMLEKYARIERRIQTPHSPTMFPAYRVAKAQDHRRMLSRICELFVARPH